MATLKDIRNQISSIKSTQQITKAMKMVAAAKLRKAQKRMLSVRPYADKIQELLFQLMSGVEDVDDPFLIQRKINTVFLVVITADRGLCGSFNSHIIRRTLMELHKLKDLRSVIVPVGIKGNNFFKKGDFELGKNFIDIFSTLNISVVAEIIDYLTSEYLHENSDQVKIIYNEFKSVTHQNLIVEQILPIKIEPVEEKTIPDYIYEPSKIDLLRSVLPKYLKMQIWRALLESYAAELGARMTAMENATENAGELIHELSLQYNKVRQASITKEILEIVGGAEALKGAS
jgi:F-type H+-transporting ATPase subunit gamma